jgi:excisionase family DNA binding protein
MPRRAIDIDGVAELLSLTKHQVYKLVRREQDPLPFRKIGKHLRFDPDRVWAWFDSQPGRDGDQLSLE